MLTVSRVSLDRPCAANASVAIERAVKFLQAHGYRLEIQGSAHATLLYEIGTQRASRLDQCRHHLDLRADGERMSFVFRGLDGRSSYVTKKERKLLEQRAGEVAAAADAPARVIVAKPVKPVEKPPADEFRCRYCTRLTPLDEPNCRHCGEANFG
jgi:hypothetical protein